MNGDLLAGTPVALGGQRGFEVTRNLPHRSRRTVGAWCFLDAYGPHTGVPMRVAPHPHTGLQTVSWLLDGEIRHRDTLGSDRTVRPGELNLMTAGRGIAHAEDSPAAGPLHGVQLWVALPHTARDRPPSFDHHAGLPTFTDGSVRATVLMGALGGVVSPAATHTPLVGAQLDLGSGKIPLNPDFEYAVLTLTGEADIAGTRLPPGPLLYLAEGRRSVHVSAAAPGTKALLIGGEPFTERLVMWWNFVARSHDEVVEARTEWMSGQPGRFGEVKGHEGTPLPAPAMPTTRLVPRGRVR